MYAFWVDKREQKHINAQSGEWCTRTPSDGRVSRLRAEFSETSRDCPVLMGSPIAVPVSFNEDCLTWTDRQLVLL